MGRPARTPLVVQYLMSRLAAGQERFPTTASIAHECGVARSTAARAVQVLKSKGLLVTRGCAGIWRAPGTLSTEVFPTESDGEQGAVRWKQVRERLRHEVLLGALSPGAVLPPVKVLVEQYGTCSRVVSRSLHSLVEDGLLEPHRRGYRICSRTMPQSLARLRVVSRIAPTDVGQGGAPWAPEFWQTLEREAARRGMGLDLRYFDPSRAEASADARHVRSLLTDRATIGTVLLLGTYRYEQREQLAELLRGQAGPVAAVEEHGHYPVPPALRMHPAVSLYSIGVDPRDGRAVGRHLVQLGHRRAVVFSLVEGSLWARSRAAGVARAFEEAGLRGAVTDLTLPAFASFDDIYAEIGALPEYRQIVESVERFAQRHAPAGGGRLFSSMVQLVPFMFTQFLPARMEQVFQEAVRISAATAWVAVNDLVALMALEFLRRHRVPVPRAISVAGFDDTVESFRAGLTSYNFAAGSVVHAIVNGFVNQRTPPRPESRRTPETRYCPGYVVARNSTAPPRC